MCARIKMPNICTIVHVCHLACVPSAFSHSNTSTLSVTKLHYERNISAHTYEMRYWFAIWYCNTRRRAVGLQTTYWLVVEAWNRNTLWNPHDVDTQYGPQFLFFFSLMTNAHVNIDSFFPIIFYASLIRRDVPNFKVQ